MVDDHRTNTASPVSVVLAIMAILAAGVAHAADKPIIVTTFSVLGIDAFDHYSPQCPFAQFRVPAEVRIGAG
jgi:hypothetical protein